MHRQVFLTGLVLCLWALTFSACSQDVTPTSPPPTSDNIQTTLSALQAENELLRTQIALLQQTPAIPSATSTPTSSPSPQPTTLQTLTPTIAPLVTIPAPASGVTVTHPSAPGYVFFIDSTEWVVDRLSTGSVRFLVRANAADCRVNLINQATQQAVPQRLHPQVIGRRIWLVNEFANSTIYSLIDLSLEMTGIADDACRTYQQIVMEDLLTTQEAGGGLVTRPELTPPARPELSNFSCQGALPIRLRTGDRALIVAEYLWLRKEPNPSESTQIRLFPQYAPVQVDIINGPQCIRPAIYWQVRVTELSSNPQVFEGWMAESDGTDYFLDTWYSGW